MAEFQASEGFEYVLVYWDFGIGGGTFRAVELGTEQNYRTRAEELTRTKGKIFVCRLVNIVDPKPVWRL